MDIYITTAATAKVTAKATAKVTPKAKDYRAQISLGQMSAREIGAGNACVIGAAGSTKHKGEGDRATPLGSFALRRLWYRPDREAHPISPLPIEAITPQCGWADDPDDRHYNQAISLSRLSRYPYRYETLWRQDHLYNLFFELGYNDAPIIKGAGSAIFLHLAPKDTKPTEGCVGVSRTIMADIIARATKNSFIHIT